MQLRIGMSCERSEVDVSVEDHGSGADGDCADQTVDEFTDGFGGAPIVIDWFDAVVGHSAADVARTMLLIQGAGATDVRHLPGATPDLVDSVGAAYAERLGRPRDDEVLGTWKRVHAVGRLSERTDLDTSGLLSMWRAGAAVHPPTTS